MTATQPRQPAGAPTGGQFAGMDRPESDVDLASGTSFDQVDPEGAFAFAQEAANRREAASWGTTGVVLGSRTPWGEADSVTQVAPGIVSVGTPSHGGMKLSPERNRLVPPALRNRSGWYEEDVEANIVLATFPTEYAHHRVATGSYAQDDPWRRTDHVREQATASIKRWMPDQYEKATGVRVTAAESSIVAGREFRAAHAGDHVTVSASYSDEHPGMVEVTATRGGERPGLGQHWEDPSFEKRTFLVPKTEYDTRSEHGFVVDPARHQDITRPPAPPAPAARRYYPPVPGAAERARTMTAAKSARVAADLEKRWRCEDGQVRTLAQILASQGVTGKRATFRDGRTEYALEQREREGDSSYTALPVSKATYDALPGVPDSATARDRARQDLLRAEHAHDKALKDPGLRAFYGDTRAKATAAEKKAKERLAAARAAYEATKETP